MTLNNKQIETVKKYGFFTETYEQRREAFRATPRLKQLIQKTRDKNTRKNVLIWQAVKSFWKRIIYIIKL